ncbi:unnamed protein product [Adineta ricciae]|uniref:Uncharacterized protein n=1 Tax=Adineta ricciae TaxID=249248 RepID=A0A814S3S4_ADIRI|nr:unnamed protein product [Adineta ricciae]
MSKICFSCSISLIGSKYYTKNDHPYCISCYEEQFSKTCAKCNQKIRIGQQSSTWANKSWHNSCFSCTDCDVSLMGFSSILNRNKQPYCANCYNLRFSPRCEKCGRIIESGTSWIDVKGNKLHPHCFTCTQCRVSLNNQLYYEHNQSPYCATCDAEYFCHKCAKCGQTISRGSIYSKHNGLTIHNTCFTCHHCGQMIKGSYRERNSQYYHPSCLDGVPLLERRRSFVESNYNDPTEQDQTKYGSFATKSTQRRTFQEFSTITALNLTAPRAKTSRTRRSFNDTPNTPLKSTQTDLTHSIRPEKQIQSQQLSLPAAFPLPVRQDISLNPTNHSDIIPPRIAVRKTKTCQVCSETKPISSYSNRISRQCKHSECKICNECIYQHVAHASQTMCRADVRCPELDCPIILDYEALKKILQRAQDFILLERYDRFYVEHQLEKNPEFIWCTHGCGSGQLAENGDQNNIITCIKCGKKSCFIHRVKWHEGVTCADYDRQIDGNRQATHRWLSLNTKQCPSCQSAIEKRSGCDHMTCARCHFEFCWGCLANYANIRNDGNHRHHPHCRHYRALPNNQN